LFPKIAFSSAVLHLVGTNSEAVKNVYMRDTSIGYSAVKDWRKRLG
jgi:hypothetical protein